MNPSLSLPNKASGVISWTFSGRTATVMALVFETQSEAWGLGWVEQSIARRMSATAGRAPQRKSTTFGGRPARHLTWRGGRDEADAFLISNHDTFYALVLEGSALEAPEIEALKAGFTLVE